MDTTPTPQYARGATGGVRAILRLEGALVLVACALGFAKTGVSWWWFAATFFLPDLSLIAYAGGGVLGARVYNTAHSYSGPLLLVLLALLGVIGAWSAPVALVWSAHIGFDRLLAYGLKYDSAFADTHLGQLQRQPRPPRNTGHAATITHPQ